MITKDTLIADTLEYGDPEQIAEVLASFGMHCLHCALAAGETVGEAAMAHGADVDAMIDALNEVCKK